jgi:hypothetical protein
MLKEELAGEVQPLALSLPWPSRLARTGKTFPTRVLQGGSASAEGTPDPLSSPGSWAAWPWEDYTSQRSQGKQKTLWL